MPQINLKLDGVPIKIPNGFFPQETWKMYTEKQRAKDFFFFFQETCQENLYEKANNQE